MVLLKETLLNFHIQTDYLWHTKAPETLEFLQKAGHLHYKLTEQAQQLTRTLQ